jgi:hypothetical protein
MPDTEHPAFAEAERHEREAGKRAADQLALINYLHAEGRLDEYWKEKVRFVRLVDLLVAARQRLQVEREARGRT